LFIDRRFGRRPTPESDIADTDSNISERAMKERVAGMRRGAVRSAAALVIVPGLLTAIPAAAANAMPDFISDFNFSKYFDFTTFNWPTVLLVGGLGLLIIALVAKLVLAARPSSNVESRPGDEGSWRRIGNMPAEPSEKTEPAQRSVERDADSRRGIEHPLPPGFPV
jgi:hypothetical protein